MGYGGIVAVWAVCLVGGRNGIGGNMKEDHPCDGCTDLCCGIHHCGKYQSWFGVIWREIRKGFGVV